MGKTTLSVEIILQCYMPHVKRCFAVCPTFWNQNQLAPLRQTGAFNEKNVFTRVDDMVFEYIYRKLLDNIPTLLFVDDAAAESATNKGNKGSFSRLCLASPHLNLSIVGCFQRLTSASPAFRDNAEALISFTPSKVLDVETIIEEFNPMPAHADSKKLVKKALCYAWDNARFCFIFREGYTGKMHFFAGFDRVIHFETV